MTATQAKPTFSFQAADLAHVGVFAALIAALAIVPGFQIGPVPFTLQTLGVALAGLCLGPIRGFAAVALYVAMGAAGLPVFNKGASGIGAILGPTGGYLLSFPFAALLSGFVAMLVVRRGLSTLTPFLFFGGLLLSRYLVILPFGVVGLMRALGKSFQEAIAIDAAFWLSDAIKSVIAVLLALAVHRAFPRLLVQR